MKQLITALAIALAAVACTSRMEETTNLSGLAPEAFKTDSTALYTLRNAAGMEACITNYGGRVVSLMVQDGEGNMRDVVLGHDSIQDYINIDGNFGALIGRYGNRINQGKFTLDGKTYTLPQNNYGHCLHGGDRGFHHAVWNAHQTSDSTLVLTLSTPDGYAGFPGKVDVKVTYTLRDRELAISYSAFTDAPTILNLTNHSYFNLSGNPSADILAHTLYIDSDSITPIDSTFMTSGVMMAVKDTPFDFNNPTPIGERINDAHPQLAAGHGYDHNFVLRSPGDSTHVAARVQDPSSGIVMEVLTTEPGIQLYVGNFLDGSVKGKKGIPYAHRTALCLETQHYPDSPNHPNWPSVVLRPGREYRSYCAYRFPEVKKN